MQSNLSHPLAAAGRGLTAVAVAVTLAILLLSMGAAPADAKSSFMSRTSGFTANAEWTQIDGIPTGTSPVGNVHIGWLNAYETTNGRADVWGWIDDFDCPEGEHPYGGHHGVAAAEDENGPGGCMWMGSRFVEGSNLSFTVDRKLSRARLTGNLVVTGHGDGHGHGPVLGTPGADISWNGVGGTFSERYTYRWQEAGTTYSSTYNSTGRAAVLSGNIGPMGFDPDLSGGDIRSFKDSSKSRTR